MKRVCMVAYTHYRSDARPRREAETLAARGDEVDFVSLGEGPARQEDVVESVRVIELPARRYRGSSALSYVRSYGRFFAQALAVVSARHARRRYDVVHVHTMPDFMVFTAAAAKLSGARVVLDVHDTMPELYQSKFGVGAGHPLIRALALEERASCAFADHVICVHGPHKELLVSRGVPARKVTPLLNVPDPKVFGPPRDPDAVTLAHPPRLVYHGTVAERLGLDVALEAFAKVLAPFPEARFDIIGTGDDAQRLHGLIAQRELAGSVHFSDRHFPVAEVPRLIDGASLGLVPNRDDPATRHMLPVKLLEYVHLGIPVVAPRLPVIQHYFGDDAVAFYRPGDAQSMADAIVGALGDPTRTLERRRAAAAFARQYSWDNHKLDLYAVIDGREPARDAHRS
jgi:glycosyltransferase involved in cell wall biosynthesis